MNPSAIMANMKKMSEEDIIKSMNLGSIPPWMGVAELTERKNMKLSSAKAPTSTVMGDAVGFANGGMVEETYWNGYEYVPISQMDPNDPRFDSQDILSQRAKKRSSLANWDSSMGMSYTPPLPQSNIQTVWNGYEYVPADQISKDDPRFDGGSALKMRDDDTRADRYMKHGIQALMEGAATATTPGFLLDLFKSGADNIPLGSGYAREYGSKIGKSLHDFFTAQPWKEPAPPAPPIEAGGQKPVAVMPQSANSSMGMSYTPAIPGEIPTIQTALPRLPTPAAPSMEDWAMSALDKAESSVPEAASISDLVKAMLPQPIDNSDLMAQRRAIAENGRNDMKNLGLLALGGGMLSSPGSFAMGLGAGANAMTPVMQKGFSDYNAALQDLMKDELGVRKDNADLKSRNANSMIGAYNTDIGLSNAREERVGRRFSALVEGKKLDDAALDREARIKIAELRSARGGMGMSPKDMDNAARDIATKMIGEENIGLGREEMEALWQRSYTKALEMIQRHFMAGNDSESVQVEDGTW